MTTWRTDPQKERRETLKKIKERVLPMSLRNKLTSEVAPEQTTEGIPDTCMCLVNIVHKVLILIKTGVHNSLSEGASVSEGQTRDDEFRQVAFDEPHVFHYIQC